MSEIDQYPPTAMDVENLTAAELMEASGGSFITVAGGNLFDRKFPLVGVPHIITGITFQAPQMKNKGGTERDFCSIEATIVGEADLARAIKRGALPNVSTLDESPVIPDERIIYNDGSTGIRRQLVEMLNSAGIITVGNTGKLPKDVGNRFDLPWTMWENSGTQHRTWGEGDEQKIVPYITNDHNGNQLIIRVLRGLRVSTYSNEFATDAETFYLS